MANQILASKEELLESKTFVKQGSIFLIVLQSLYHLKLIY